MLKLFLVFGLVALVWAALTAVDWVLGLGVFAVVLAVVGAAVGVVVGILGAIFGVMAGALGIVFAVLSVLAALLIPVFLVVGLVKLFRAAF